MARGKDAYLDHLRSVPLFVGCNQKELERVAKVSDELTVPAGHVIIDQGQMGHEAFVLMSGSATVTRNGQQVARVGAGAVLGELSLLDHGPRTATVITDEETTLLVIDQRNFSGILDTTPSIARKILASLASKVRDFDRQYYG